MTEENVGEPTGRREQLLAAAVEYAATNGISDLSLRQLAAALGTSHRMLVYHFGSKEGLLVAVVRAVEEQQRRFLAELGAGDKTGPGAGDKAAGAGAPDKAGPGAGTGASRDLSPVEQGRRLWDRLADPAMWPYEMLFFEVYSQALRGRPHTAEMLAGIVESWVAPVAELMIADGVPPQSARATARLGVAVTRGLLLDLLATGDQDGVRAAMERFLELYPGTVGPPGPAGQQ